MVDQLLALLCVENCNLAIEWNLRLITDQITNVKCQSVNFSRPSERDRRRAEVRRTYATLAPGAISRS